jgi:hypothetical protein
MCLKMTPVAYRCGLFASKAAHLRGLCRTMEHGIGSGSTAPGYQGRPAEGVMVRRTSVASLDSGAESPVYGTEPSASADRVGPVARPPWSGGGGRRAVRRVRAVPGFFQAFASGDQAALDTYPAPGVSVSGFGGAVGLGATTSLQVPQGGKTRHITVTVDRTLPGQAGTGAAQLAATHDTSMVGQRSGSDQRSGRWYVKGHPCVCAADGNPMTRYASSWAVPRGLRSLCKLTDAHGREG